MIAVPAELRRKTIARLGYEGKAWVDSLPQVVARLAERWSLSLGPPFDAGYSYVAPATRADGTPAVLKLNSPDLEWPEAEGLRFWAGRGMVLLLDEEPDQLALLLERAQPGTPLADLPDEEEADAHAAAVLRRLWRPVPNGHAFELVADHASDWAQTTVHRWDELGRPFERSLAEQAQSAAAELVATEGDRVLLHTDFHLGNVLAAEREPWLAIDPKPWVGEREFDTYNLLRWRPRSLDRLASALDLDRERMTGWAVAYGVRLLLFTFEVEPWGGEKELAGIRQLAQTV